jgi:predicted RNA-binding Zn ribbon-like protein
VIALVSATHDLRFDTGRTCLDLMATVGSRLSSSPVERLDSTERLATWLYRAGVIPADEPLDLDAVALEEFVSLRAILHRVLHGELDGHPATAADISRMNCIAAAGPPISVLVRTGGELRRRLGVPPRLEQLLAVVCEDAICLLSSPDRLLLRECEGPTCDLVYVDTSRGRRRRWCSAEACGNRHYVAEYRARKANAEA